MVISEILNVRKLYTGMRVDVIETYLAHDQKL